MGGKNKILRVQFSGFLYFNLQPIYTQFGAARKCRTALHQKAGHAIKTTRIPAKLRSDDEARA